jgi:epoxyqueuosine reductase QueG
MEELREKLIEKGADLVGFADLHGTTIDETMPFGISAAVRLAPELIASIHDGPNRYYFEEYHRINKILDALVTYGENYLTEKGYKAFAQTTSAVTETDGYITKLPHKTVATRAGLGWIGKCGLLVTKEYGSAVRISSLITNAKLECGEPFNSSLCGDCMECTNNCPGGAVSGTLWNTGMERKELIDVYKCRKAARALAMKRINEKITLCGKCIEVCPYTKKYTKN